jgi:hypothetical protein
VSLDFSLGKIKNYKEVCWQETDEDGTQLKPRTHQIIWGCMSTGIGVINERTIPEWKGRYDLWCKIHDLDDPVPTDVLYQHIGLSTNVFPEESRAKWLKRIVARELDGTKRMTEIEMGNISNV